MPLQRLDQYEFILSHALGPSLPLKFHPRKCDERSSLLIGWPGSRHLEILMTFESPFGSQ
jgi:hypothetical protein